MNERPHLPPLYPMRPGERLQGGPPAFNVPPVTLALAVLLVGVFAALHLLPEGVANAIGQRFSFSAVYFLRALDGQGSLAIALPMLVTHMFLHFDALHLAVNVGFLLAFASVVERRFGWIAMLLLFLASGIAGALFETWFFPDRATLHIPMIGASGGIMGLMAVGLIVATAPREPMSSGVRRPPLLRVLAALIGLNVVIGLLSDVGLTGPYLIGWRAHLGGFALGLAVGWVVRRLER